MDIANNEVDSPTVTLPPVIAIHGVGNHEPDKIKESLHDAFNRASISMDIEEFNWDRYVDHSAKQVHGVEHLLSTTASSISQAAALAYRPSGRGVDRVLFTLEQGLYHGVLRFLVAIGLAILLVGPLLHLMVLLPSWMFTGLLTGQLMWVKTAAILVIIAGLFVILGLFTLSGLRSLATFSLRPLWVSIRRVVLLSLQPVFLLLTAPLSARFYSAMAQWVYKVMPMALLSSILSIVLSPLFGEFSETFSGIGVGFSIIVGIAIVAGLHFLLRKLWVGTLLKVMLDIMRYMGSPEYRATLMEEFDREIIQMRSRGDGHSFVLYAHSLGSVIALDSIVNSRVWQRDDEIQLVTLGSPIARFFIRFFPGYLFPPSIRDAANAAACRLRWFSWINIHRRWDYVGTRLGLETANVGLEVSTGQWTKIVSAHSNYWEDDLVVQIFKNNRKRVVPVVAKKTATHDVNYILPATHADIIQNRVARLVQIVAFLSVLLVFGIAAFNFIESRGAWTQSLDQEIVDIQQKGERAVTAVTYHRTLEGGGKDSYYLHHFVFRLPDPHGQLPPIEIADNVIYSQYARHFDYNALADFVLENCKPAEEKKWWQIFRSRKSIPCTRTEIPILFKTGNPASFLLPGFPTKPTFGNAASEWMGSLVLAVFFASGCFFVVMYGGVPLFRLFLGLSAKPQSGQTDSLP